MATETPDTAAVTADTDARQGDPQVVRLSQHTVEIVSDSGEGAQKCGQIFGTVSAKMGNGVWTVEIIPAEIEPPPRTIDGGERQSHPHRCRGPSRTGATAPTWLSPSTSRRCLVGIG